jgi:DNA-binding transcriptional MerR regulator
MVDSNNYQNEFVPIAEAAKILRVSKGTLHRWDREGILSPARLPNGHRRYSVAKLREILGAA